jgi:hypothetical protein
MTAFGRFGKGGRMVEVYVVDFSSHRSVKWWRKRKEQKEEPEKEKLTEIQPDIKEEGDA